MSHRQSFAVPDDVSPPASAELTEFGPEQSHGNSGLHAIPLQCPDFMTEIAVLDEPGLDGIKVLFIDDDVEICCGMNDMLAQWQDQLNNIDTPVFPV